MSVLWLQGTRGDVSRCVIAGSHALMVIFVHADYMKTRIHLTAELLGERMTVFERVAICHQFRRDFGMFRVGIRQLEFYFHSSVLGFVEIENIEDRIHETGQHRSAMAQHTEGFAPDRTYFVDEQIRNGVEDEVE